MSITLRLISEEENEMEDSLEAALISMLVAGTILTGCKNKQPEIWTEELDVALESITAAMKLVQAKNQKIFSNAVAQTMKIVSMTDDNEDVKQKGENNGVIQL